MSFLKKINKKHVSKKLQIAEIKFCFNNAIINIYNTYLIYLI